ncbi:hypothetical protein NE865_04035 [Phthorimaea operculella]|nr:hypothetical protein NE865_04035 [Phthorimaea operculella]
MKRINHVRPAAPDAIGFYVRETDCEAAMNEGAPLYGGGGFGGPSPVYMVNNGGAAVERGRPYPIEVLQALGGAAPAPHPFNRSHPRRDYNHNAKGDSAFGYESDDSSLSSNASGSNKSGEKGEGPSRNVDRANGYYGGWGGREWRGGGRSRREPRRRIAPERYLNSTYPFQVKFTPDELLNVCRQVNGRREPRRRIAPERYLNSTYPFQVKFTPDELLNGSEWDSLSQEIWEKFVKSQQTEETFRKKMNLWRYLYITIKSIFPRYGLYVVGSTMSGFGLDSSDMDLCLYVRPLDNVDPRAHALLHLNYILTYIKSFDPGMYYHI